MKLTGNREQGTGKRIRVWVRVRMEREGKTTEWENKSRVGRF